MSRHSGLLRAIRVDASLGDMWVVQNRTGTELPDSPAFTARRGDGKWAALPNPPEPYESAALASVAGEVVLGGVVCDDPGECVSGNIEWSTLADDLTSWNVLDADLAFDNDHEAVITSMPGRHDVGVFSTPSGRVVIDAEHQVRPIPSNTGGAVGDGTLYLLTGLGFPVLRRGTHGTWSDTGVNATSVASTEAIALALNIDQPDVTEIPRSD